MGSRNGATNEWYSGAVNTQNSIEINITDANNCNGGVDLTGINLAGCDCSATGSSVIADATICAEDSTTVTVTYGGGAGNYNITLAHSTGANQTKLAVAGPTSTFKIADAGNYAVTVESITDNCFVSGGQVSLAHHTAPVAWISGDASICNDGVTTTDLTITLTAGADNFSCDLEGASSGTTGLTGLTTPHTEAVMTDGVYTLNNLVDGNGCVGTTNGNATISYIDDVQATSRTECFDGTPLGGVILDASQFQIVVTVTQGDLSNINITETTAFGITFTRNGTTNEWFSDAIWEGNTVDLNITDQNDCNHGTSLSGITSRCSCPVFANSEIQDMTICQENRTTITVTYGGSAGNYTISLTQPSSANQMDINTPGPTSTFTVNEIGTYQVIVESIADACTVNGGSISLAHHTVPIATIITENANICGSRAAPLTIVLNQGQEPFSVDINGLSSTSLTNITSPHVHHETSDGTYVLSNVIDGNGCIGSVTGSATVNHLDTVQATFQLNNTSCESDTFNVEVLLQGDAPHNFNIHHNGIIVDAITNYASSNYHFESIGTGYYSLSKNNCTNPDSVYFDSGLKPSAWMRAGHPKICEGNSQAEFQIQASGSDSVFINIREPNNNLVNLKTGNGEYVYQATQAGTYKLESVSDANCLGVVFSDTVYIEQVDSLCGRISGSIFIEEDNDCIKNGSNEYVQFRQLKVSPGDFYITTGNDGLFDLPFGYGTYTLEPVVKKGETLNCSGQDSYTFTLDNSNSNQDNLDFAIHEPNNKDLKTYFSSSTLRPGFDANLYVYANNYGGQDETASIYALIPQDLIIKNTNPSYDRISGDTVFWDDLSLIKNTRSTFLISINVPASTALGTILTFESYVDSLFAESNVTNNKFVSNITVRGSYDPNDKTVLPSGEGEFGEIDVSENSLLYRIRFQNTGTDTAFTVVVLDTISPYLDLGKLDLVEASHDYDFEIITPGNVLKWTFNNILLADSVVDEPNSHGSIYYSIGIKENKKLGDVIKNSADIYFDYNLPVKTNTTVTTISKITGLDPIRLNKVNGLMTIYPNPSSDIIYVKVEEINEPTELKIYDVMGTEMASQSISESLSEIQVSNLETGVYLIEIVQGDTRSVERVIIE